MQHVKGTFCPGTLLSAHKDASSSLLPYPRARGPIARKTENKERTNTRSRKNTMGKGGRSELYMIILDDMGF